MDLSSYLDFKLDTQWSVSGSRVDCSVGANEYLEAKLPSSFNASTITATNRAVYEVTNVVVRSDGALAFRVVRGLLQTQLATRTLKLAVGTVIIVDFQALTSDQLDANSTLVVPALVVTRNATAADVNADRLMLVARDTSLFVVSKYNFTWDNVLKSLSLRVTFAPATTLAITTTPPPTTAAPLPTCLYNCNGHGVCVADYMCECYDNFVPSEGACVCCFHWSQH